ncbi:MAG: response regulator transcription factor [Akkermansiaceae bacterium]|nr:response regulator transcription factor [Verrucomicrobiales bacterium]
MKSHPGRVIRDAVSIEAEIGSIGVSIIEDDPRVREIFVGWIKSTCKFHVVSNYGSGERALDRLPAEKPSVVLVDINLPRMNGIDCVRRLKPLLPGTQFVMLTVYDDADNLFHALAAGASGYLLKQTNCEQLLDAIQEVHAGGGPLSNNIARKIIESFHRTGTEIDEAQELTAREQRVLELLARGDLYKEIADTLGITIPTVNTHVRHIYDKLHVRSRTMAAAKYARMTPTVHEKKL